MTSCPRPKNIVPLLLCCGLAACDISGLVLPPAGETEIHRRGDVQAENHRALVDALGRIAGARELSLLRPLLTRRMATTLDEVTRGLNAERFWQHLGKLQRGIRAGYSFPKAIARDDGRLELPLHFVDGENAQLLIMNEDGQPRIDRF